MISHKNNREHCFDSKLRFKLIYRVGYLFQKFVIILLGFTWRRRHVTDAIQLAIDNMDLTKKSTLNVLIIVSVSWMIESGHFDLYLETRLSGLADSTMCIDSVICQIMNRRRFITPATHYIQTALHDQINVGTVHACLGEAASAPHDASKRDPGEILSLLERSPSPSARHLTRRKICAIKGGCISR